MIRELYIFGPDRYGTGVEQLYGLKRDQVSRQNIPRLCREIAQSPGNGNFVVEFHTLPLPRQTLYYSFEERYSFFLLADKNIRANQAKEKLQEVKRIVWRFLEGGDPWRGNPWRESFDKKVKEAVKSTLKAILIGESAVGKTTCWRLIDGEKLPVIHKATMMANPKMIELGLDDDISLWDIPGQVGFEKDWPRVVKDSNVIIIVFDSQLQSIEKARWVIGKCKEWEPNAKMVVIANKQDKPEALPSDYIEKHLRTPTWGLQAINPEYRSILQDILREAVESEVL